MNKKYLGSNFDDFLKEEGLLAEAEAVAVKRVVAFQEKQPGGKRKRWTNRVRSKAQW